MSDWIIDVVGELGYIGIFLLTFLENVFPPIPSELIMPLAGFHTANGRLSLWGAILAGSSGSLLGTVGWYWVGRRVGERRLRAFVERYGCWIGIDVEHLDRSKQWFERRGVASVFIGRLIPGVRTLISVPAGFSDMPLWEFLLPSAAGTLLWTAGLTYAGNLLGHNYAEVKGYVGIVSWAFLAIVVLLYVRRQIQHFLRRGAREQDSIT